MEMLTNPAARTGLPDTTIISEQSSVSESKGGVLASSLVLEGIIAEDSKSHQILP